MVLNILSGWHSRQNIHLISMVTSAVTGAAIFVGFFKYREYKRLKLRQFSQESDIFYISFLDCVLSVYFEAHAFIGYEYQYSLKMLSIHND